MGQYQTHYFDFYPPRLIVVLSGILAAITSRYVDGGLIGPKKRPINVAI